VVTNAARAFPQAIAPAIAVLTIAVLTIAVPMFAVLTSCETHLSSL
jgi:hypothetical protein